MDRLRSRESESSSSDDQLVTESMAGVAPVGDLPPDGPAQENSQEDPEEGIPPELIQEPEFMARVVPHGAGVKLFRWLRCAFGASNLSFSPHYREL
jgi:hypothetical protein